MSARGRLAAGLAALALLAARAPRAGADATDAGTHAASFLADAGAPAVAGMGGAAVGLGRDLAASPWNVAALGWLTGTQIVLAHQAMPDQTGQEWLGAGGRTRGGMRWAVTALYRDDGTITGRDANDAATANVSAESDALALQLARPLGAHAVVGGGLQYVGEHVGDAHGNGLAFDAGVQARAGAFGFGLAAQHFGGGMEWAGRRWPMPATLAGGLAWEHPAGLRLALDLAAPANYYRSVRLGGEWRWQDRFALRAGWRHELGAPDGERLDGPAFGASLSRGGFAVDYAYVVGPNGAGAQRFALQLTPGRLGLPPAPAAPAGPDDGDGVGGR